MGHINKLDNHNWQEVKQIIKHSHTEYDNMNLQSIGSIWKTLLSIRERYLENIARATRINTRLCYMLDEEAQVKEVNSLLFRLNHLYDQDFYDLTAEADSGITKFMHIFHTTYSNLDSYLEQIEAIENNFEFANNRLDLELVDHYKYLKNISLPVKGYEELRMNLFTILKKFNQLTPLLTDISIFNKFMTEIKEFKNLYIQEYKKRHLYFQNQFDYFQRKLYTLPEYKVLDRLSDINIINNKENIKSVKEYIDSFFARKCEKENIENILKKQPKCSCGFSIGEKNTIPEINKITPVLERAIRTSLRQLHKNKYIKSQITKFCKQHSDSPVNIILRGEDLLKLEGRELSSIINREFINHFNKALKETHSVNIKIDKIADKLVGSYTLTDINKLSEKVESVIMELVNRKYDNDREIIINIVS